MASTGVAASNFEGQTLHSLLSLGSGDKDFDELRQDIQDNPNAEDIWKNLDFLIVDEAGAIHKNVIEVMDKLGKAFRPRNCMKSFGGLQLMFVGDYLQLPPVKRDNDSRPTYNFFLKGFLEYFDRFYLLEKVMRQGEQQNFAALLSRARTASVNREDVELLKKKRDDYLNEVSEFNTSDVKTLQLHCTNAGVATVNAEEYAKLRREQRKKAEEEAKDSDMVDSAPQQQMQNRYPEKSYTAEDHCCDPNGGNVQTAAWATDILNSRTRIKKHITLCVGMPVMLTKNLSVSSGLYNGARGEVLCFESVEDKPEVTYPKVKFYKADGTFFVEHILPVQSEVHMTQKSMLTRSGLPLAASFCTTVHKAQGLTVGKLILHMKDAFAHGQVYVALSRVRCLEDVAIASLPDDEYHTRNIFSANPYARAFYEALASGLKEGRENFECANECVEEIFV